ncbi:MAG: MBL fold metallo-hydrolase, partial [Spirochaetaceae bacterium]
WFHRDMLDSLKVTIVAEDSVGYETPYLGQHGVSFFLEARGGGVERRVLVDVAQHPGPLLSNMELLGIEPPTIDTIILTHCHYDHTQGLAEVLEAIGKQDLPVIAHPEIFRLNFATEPELRHIGVMSSDTQDKIEAAGGTLYFTREPLQILPGLTTSGEIPRVTEYENKEENLKTFREGKIVVDRMIDEMSVYGSVAGVGTVIVTGCSHPGIVNITKHARALAREAGPGADGAGAERVAAVIGGFHLIESNDERIRRTVTDLKAEAVGHVYAGHCTGFPAQAALYTTFGEAFTPLRTGLVLSFG